MADGMAHAQAIFDSVTHDASGVVPLCICSKPLIHIGVCGRLVKKAPMLKSRQMVVISFLEVITGKWVALHRSDLTIGFF